MTNTNAAPTHASLWTVDADGIGQGKPHAYDRPLAVVHAHHRMLVAQGHDPSTLRITPHGTRPDKLGRQR